LIRSPWAVLATVAVVVVGKPPAALLIVRGAFGRPRPEALGIAASLAQIGEFSFILAALGVSLGLLPEEGRALVLAASIASILANPLLFAAAERFGARRHAAPAGAGPPTQAAAAVAAPGRPAPPPVTALAGHDVLVGHGRVGALVAAGLKACGDGRPLLVIEDGAAAAEAARRGGADEVLAGNAADPAVLRAANLGAARRLVVAIPEAFEAGQVVEQARAANPALRVVARAHSDGAAAHLSRLGADLVVSGEREIARCILEDMRGEPAATADLDAKPEQGGPRAPAPPPWTGGNGRAVEPPRRQEKRTGMPPARRPSPNPLDPRLLTAVAGLTLLLGAALFALPPTAEPPPLQQVGAAAAAMAVWSYCDGFFGRRDWGMAALKGVLLTKAALHWTALLLEAFGAP